MLMTEHHLVHDGKSALAFLSEVLDEYVATLAGETFVPVPAPSYEDYIAHLRLRRAPGGRRTGGRVVAPGAWRTRRSPRSSPA
ncbi:hypothetical protein [Nocardioides convexus]|uniref:hypothetical protein n=1 Tax=Nocardioides convexus TaxID=2712224 RepID=UPI0024182661|nr:hypothetical protein [Nocardioides convexus]